MSQPAAAASPIVVVDYDMGNVGSVVNMLRRVGHRAVISRSREEIERAPALILTGVGAFDEAARNLGRLDLIGPLNEAVQGRRVPVLGICLGMQLLGAGSDEGNLPGFGWIKAHTRRFELTDLPVPHMGWSPVLPIAQRAATPSLADNLFHDTAEDQRYYFVHSYHVCCERPEDVKASATYGIEFTAAIGADHVAGTQFHPEKSHRFGMQILRNFTAHAARQPELTT